MSNRGMYIDPNSSGRRRRRRGPGAAMICGVSIVIVLAVIFGVLAYQVSKQNAGELPGVPTPTVAPTPTLAPTFTPVPGTPTPTPTPTNTPTPTSTPTPTATNTPTPVPTSPETMQPCTPTPSPSPSPTPKPAWDDNYLIGFEDTREKVNVIGAYAGLNLNSTARVNQWIELAETTELNAVVIDVKADTGKVTYRMDLDYLKEMGVCLNHYTDMKGLLKTLKEHGIYTIARVVCFKDNFIDDVHPEYMLRKNDGTMYRDNEGDTWINPYNRDAWKYIIDICEQAALDGFDEICFDYIRVATNGIIAKDLGNLQFEYKVDFGEDANDLTLRETITEFTKYACNRLKPLGVYVSACVYGVVVHNSVDAARVGQNYVDMSRYLDYICPMVYPSHYGKGWGGFKDPNATPYELILSQMKVSKKKLAVLDDQQDSYADVRPWLQAFSYGGITYDGPMVRKQVDATYEVGYTSWFLWNAGGKYPTGSFLTNEEVAALESAESAETEESTTTNNTTTE